jgi:hypothetical protein
MITGLTTLTSGSTAEIDCDNRQFPELVLQLGLQTQQNLRD